MQQLVDQGVTITNAGRVVSATYPVTHGDTFYRSDGPHDRLGYAVGVYGLWNSLRGDQSPLGGTKVSDDARTIAQFLRLDQRDLSAIVVRPMGDDAAVIAVVARTMEAMKHGDYFAPVQVEEDDVTPDLIRDMRRSVARMDGAADYLTSIPLPHFGQ